MKSIAIIIILFINSMLINTIFADDAKNKAHDIGQNMTVFDSELLDENINNGLLSFIMYEGDKIITCKALSKCVFGVIAPDVADKMYAIFKSWHIEKLNKGSPPIIDINNLKCNLKEIELGVGTEECLIAYMDKINPNACLIKGCFYWPSDSSESIENLLPILQQDQSVVRVRLEKKYKNNIYTVVYTERQSLHSYFIFYFENTLNHGLKKLLFISAAYYLPMEWEDVP